MSNPTIPPEVAEKLGFYVYLYVDPRTDQPFYVGKGVRGRVLSHLDVVSDSRKSLVLRELKAVGMEPRLEILTHGLQDEDSALRIECAVIDLLGLDALTNEVRGWKSVEFGRLPLRDLVAYYAASPVSILHPALLIRINRRYRHNMPPQELYEATRGVWRLSERRNLAQFAIAVFEGTVREVYAIESWHPAGSTPYLTRQDVTRPGRWEFVGRPAESEFRSIYIDKKVAGYFRPGQQSPTVYVNC